MYSPTPGETTRNLGADQYAGTLKLAMHGEQDPLLLVRRRAMHGGRQPIREIGVIGHRARLAYYPAPWASS
jgi:hypothetical protein